MKVMKALLLGSFLMTISTVAVYAHDPSKHAGSNEPPDCSAMQEMNHDHMDMTDPVVQAMMKKCVGEMPVDSERQVHGSEDKATRQPQKFEGHADSNNHMH